MQVDVVIVTYNGEKWIKKCLDSLNASALSVGITVVDNVSTDGTLAIVKSYPNVHLIQQTENLGFGRANNIGISRALKNGADYVFLLNQDAYIDSQAIDILVKYASQNPAWGICSPIHLDESGLSFEYHFARFITNSPSFRKLIADFYFHTLEPAYELPAVNAAAWLISATCLEAVGGFDPIFFMYGEDGDLYRRTLHHGFKGGIIPAARIYHCHEEQTGQPRFRANREKGKMIVALLHDPRTPILSVLGWGWNILVRVLAILVGNPRYSLRTLFAAISLLPLIPTLLQHRKINAQRGPHWLDLG
jgi:GT2 family glycosyltransferase